MGFTAEDRFSPARTPRTSPAIMSPTRSWISLVLAAICGVRLVPPPKSGWTRAAVLRRHGPHREGAGASGPGPKGARLRRKDSLPRNPLTARQGREHGL